MGIVLGCDPGLNGGLAIVAVGSTPTATYVRPTLLGVSDIPTTGEGPTRRVDVLAVLRFIRKHPPDHAFVEAAGAFPGQGVSSMFRYGRAVGSLEAAIQGLLIPMTLVQPAVWKTSLGLVRALKEDSRQKALQLFPSAADQFARRLDHGRAESSLIAWYGCMQLRQNSAAE